MVVAEEWYLFGLNIFKFVFIWGVILQVGVQLLENTFVCGKW